MANIGTTDRLLRLILGAILIVISLLPASQAVLAGLGDWIYALTFMGGMLIFTALVRLCPAYVILGVRTCPMPERTHDTH